MSTEAVTIQVDTETAHAFRAASADEQKKLQSLLAVWLRELVDANASSLKQTMTDISRKAQARGLTPETLDSLVEAE